MNVSPTAPQANGSTHGVSNPRMGPVYTYTDTSAPLMLLMSQSGAFRDLLSQTAVAAAASAASVERRNAEAVIRDMSEKHRRQIDELR